MSSEQYASKVSFSIAHSSSAIIEMLLASSPVYVFDDGQLASIYLHPELSYANQGALMEAIRRDRDSADGGQARVASLKHWFNDDRDQAAKIKEALIGER